MKTKDLNRLKVVLVEQKKTAKWLASELKKETLSEIANILKVKMSELVRQD